MGNAGWVPNLLMYPPDLKKKMRCVGWQEEACLGLGGPGINVCYQSKSDRLSPLDRQITTPGKPSLTVEFNPTNPLEQGLGDRFFCPRRYLRHFRRMPVLCSRLLTNIHLNIIRFAQSLCLHYTMHQACPS